MSNEWTINIRTLNCRILENKTFLEVEVVQEIAEGVERVKERLSLTLTGRYREINEELIELATARVAEMAEALGLEG